MLSMSERGVWRREVAGAARRSGLRGVFFDDGKHCSYAGYQPQEGPKVLGLEDELKIDLRPR